MILNQQDEGGWRGKHGGFQHKRSPEIAGLVRAGNESMVGTVGTRTKPPFLSYTEAGGLMNY